MRDIHDARFWAEAQDRGRTDQQGEVAWVVEDRHGRRF
jgi:hypothetical protein